MTVAVRRSTRRLVNLMRMRRRSVKCPAYGASVFTDEGVIYSNGLAVARKVGRRKYAIMAGCGIASAATNRLCMELVVLLPTATVTNNVFAGQGGK